MSIVKDIYGLQLVMKAAVDTVLTHMHVEIEYIYLCVIIRTIARTIVMDPLWLCASVLIEVVEMSSASYNHLVIPPHILRV